MTQQTYYEWYHYLQKPAWAPPQWLFGPVWTILYIGIAVSFGYVFLQAYAGTISFTVVLPFVLNLIFNAAFTPIQFNLRNNKLAAVDAFLILGTLAWALWMIFPIVQWVALINIPHFLWVCFATVLQTTISIMNFRRHA